MARERGDTKVVLPVWHNVTHDDVLRYSPLLADKVAVSTSGGIEQVARTVLAAVRKSNAAATLPERIADASSAGDGIESIRRRTLLAHDALELRQVLYAVDAYLHQNPANPEARQLRDRILEGIAAETRPSAALRTSAVFRNPTMVLLMTLVVALVIALGIYLYFRHTSASPQPADGASASREAVPMSGAITFLSDPGDYIGEGKTQTFNNANGKLTATATSNTVTIYFEGDDHWSLDFAAPEGQRLAVGSYESAQRAAFHNPVKPGLDVSGAGRGCNKLDGRFDIRKIEFSGKDALGQFKADFEQHCDGAAPALRGSVDVVAGGK